MKLFTALSSALLCSNICGALEDSEALKSPEVLPRATETCSIGIGREFNSLNWDVTVYNVAQPERQDVNVVGVLKYAFMDKGDTITIKGLPQDIKITNVDNAPVFTYNNPEPVEPLNNPKAVTKVKLEFEMGDSKWDTDSCWATKIAFSTREGWSCDFPCPSSSSSKEL